MSAPGKAGARYEPVEVRPEEKGVASGQRVSRGHWRQWLRSVHSDCMGCGIEPRKIRHSQGPRVFIRSKATCAAPLCEVLTPAGVKGHITCKRDRIGTWEVWGLAVRGCVSGTVRIGKVRSRSR